MSTGIPEGYRMNSEGHLVPISAIKAQHLLEDELVDKLSAEAARFWRHTADDIGAFYSHFIPEAITPDHWLVAAVGLEAALKIAENIGGERLIHIPLAGTGRRKQLADEIRRLSGLNYSNAQIAQQLRIAKAQLGDILA